MAAENPGRWPMISTPPLRFNEAAANGRGKRRRLHSPRDRLANRFNEAAANGRGKHLPQPPNRPHHAVASMRPRRMAAENRAGVDQCPGRTPASMRPRRMAAENSHRRLPSVRPRFRFNEAAANGRGKHGDGGRRRIRQGHASMRPRRMAAENVQMAMDTMARRLASMRPRRMAAENASGSAEHVRLGAASMRPRRMAAENAPRSRTRRRWPGGFNEAAANGRGKRHFRRPPAAGGARFNEAAANGRGKPSRSSPARTAPGRLQ